MRDKISIPRAQALHPLIRDEVISLIDLAEAGLPAICAIRIVQGYRTFSEQNDLYSQGRTKPGPIVTKAKAGTSFHNYALAFDFAILIDTDGNGSYDELSWNIKKDNDKDGIADWLEVVKVFEAAGYEWGGKWSSIKDYPHIQKTFGLKWQDCFEIFQAGKFIPGTKYIQIP